MFDSIFGDLFGPHRDAIIGKVVSSRELLGDEERGHYFVLSKLDHFAALFLAVKLDNAEDKIIWGKPTVVIAHRKTLAAHHEKQKADEQAAQRRDFLGALVAHYKKGHHYASESPWEQLMPHYKAPADTACGGECAGRYSNRLSRPPKVEHATYLDAFCDGHRALIDEYLAQNPDARPAWLGEEE